MTARKVIRKKQRLRQIIYRFRVELLETDPLTWRLIDVPSKYDFWGLHVAIQDAMGWMDYHPHEFLLARPVKRKEIKIGIPDDVSRYDVLPGWEIPISDYFTTPGDEGRYVYDLDDQWRHSLVLEGMFLAAEGVKYPACLDGARACPPEDCGGISGFYSLLQVLADPDHKEHEEMIHWLSNHAENYYPYDAARFDANEVIFWDPRERFELAFSK